MRRARELIRAQDSALARIWRTYVGARAVVGLGVVGAQGLGAWLGVRGDSWLALVALLYGAQALSLWLLPRADDGRQRPAQQRRLWLSTIGVDLVAFTLMHLLESGASFNFAALLVLPVLMAGVLTQRTAALGTAAAVALVLLGTALRNTWGGADAPAQLLQSALAGLGLFTIAVLTGELAQRLAGEEAAARQGQAMARQQAELNALVLSQMTEGVLVVDRHLHVRAANPAARALLVERGLCEPAPFPLHRSSAWLALHQAVDQALRDGHWPEAGSDVSLEFADGHIRSLRLRVRFMHEPGESGSRPPRPDAPVALLLLEDLRTLQARTRQDKLAAMGRVSAGIAHEIRNPLMAISQANALLMEDSLPPGQARLARMVADNAARLKRLVDDVMDVAPGAGAEHQVIDATAVVSEAVVDWSTTAQLPLGAGSRLSTDLPRQPLGVVFDPEHLRRVLINLLDNAVRHATATPGAVHLAVRAGASGPVQLVVASDGDPIPADIEHRLFEPFFSTRSRGTGLGLFICRELCERYGAEIEFAAEPERHHGKVFTVTLRRAVLGEPETAPLPLEP